MPQLSATFNLDIEMAKNILSFPQMILFKVKGMSIIKILKRQLIMSGNKVKDIAYGFCAFADGTEEECKEGHEKIMKLLTGDVTNQDFKYAINSREMRFFKKIFYKGLKKIQEKNNMLSALNNCGISVDVKII